MRKTFTFIISTLLFFVGMSSCIYDEEPTTPTLPEGIQMGFTIHVGGNKPASRGADDKVEAGNDLENRIDIANRDFRVYFYEAGNDAYIGELEIISVLDVTDDSGDGYNNDYYVMGRVDDQFVTSLNAGFHMVVMANLSKWTSMEGTYAFGRYPNTPVFTPNKGSYDQCYHYGTGLDGKNNDTTFDKAPDKKGYIVSEDRLIPMWGCQTYQNIQLTENTITQLTEPIIMLRTLAKIEVNCNLEAMGLSGVQRIESVAITKSRSCVRIEQLHNNNVQFDETKTDHAYPNIRSNSDRVKDNPIYFTEQTEEGSNRQKFVIYVPEMNDGTIQDDCHPDIQVTLGGKNFTFPVSSEDGTRIPILRNHIYRYTITKITNSVEILYQGTEWHKVTNEDIIFGGNKNDEPDKYINESNESNN